MISSGNDNNLDHPNAFYDEQYYAYLKTNLKYMSELSTPSQGHNVHGVSQLMPMKKSRLLDSFKDRIKN